MMVVGMSDHYYSTHLRVPTTPAPSQLTSLPYLKKAYMVCCACSDMRFRLLHHAKRRLTLVQTMVKQDH